jgi:hypothetical protein
MGADGCDGVAALFNLQACTSLSVCKFQVGISLFLAQHLRRCIRRCPAVEMHMNLSKCART